MCTSFLSLVFCLKCFSKKLLKRNNQQNYKQYITDWPDSRIERWSLTSSQPYFTQTAKKKLHTYPALELPISSSSCEFSFTLNINHKYNVQPDWSKPFIKRYFLIGKFKPESVTMLFKAVKWFQLWKTIIDITYWLSSISSCSGSILSNREYWELDASFVLHFAR